MCQTHPKLPFLSLQVTRGLNTPKEHWPDTVISMTEAGEAGIRES